jgi:hypothetical protein
MTGFKRNSMLGLIVLSLWACLPATAQFLDSFDGPSVLKDPEGVRGWTFFTGEGRAVMDFVQGGPGYASIRVDATQDRRNVWWALIKRHVSDRLDLALLRRPGHALRVEARIRVSVAPRRVNLHVNTQRTTDFHTHLMEFDIPDTKTWHTISMTTEGFDAGPGDSVNGQMALMDWGLGTYTVDIDYFRVDVVDVKRAGPDKGEPLPYHPPVADPASFALSMPAVQAATVDALDADVNLGNWFVSGAGARTRAVSAGGSRSVILRWNFEGWAGKKAVGSGLLELTTRSLERTSDDIPDFGLIRVVEILGGNPHWERGTVTLAGLLRGQPAEAVLDPQMIIDWPVAEGDGGKTCLTITRPVLQRLIDGHTLGIAVRPLGAINAAFYGSDAPDPGSRPRLLLNVKD